MNQENPEYSEQMSPLLNAWGRFNLSCGNLSGFLSELKLHTSKLENTAAVGADRQLIMMQTTGLPLREPGEFSRYKVIIEQQLAATGLISLVTIIEYSLRDFCDALEEVMKLRLSWSDLGKTPALPRFRIYFEKVAGIDLGIEDVNWQELNALVVLRNNIVHNLGELRQEDTHRIQILMQEHHDLKIEGNRAITSMNFCQRMISKATLILSGAIARITPERLHLKGS